MALRIAFQSHHAACLPTGTQQFSIKSDGDNYPLPFIQFIPHEENLPHLCTLHVHVLCADQAVLDTLTKRFGGKEKVFNPPFKLINGLETPKIGLSMPQALSKELQATLKVTVSYKDSDAAGNPIEDRVKAASSETLITFLPASTISTTSPNQDKTSPDLNTQPTPPTTPTDQKETPPAKPTGPMFPGWIAIDFGTSNSTIAVYDPLEIRPVKGLPEEQLLRLQKKVLAWLKESPPGQNAKGLPLAEEWKKILQQIGSLQNQEKDAEAVVRIFEKGEESSIHKVLRDIEHWLPATSIELQRWAYQGLHSVYEDVFRTPPLRDLLLFHAELDQATRAKEISSELRVTNTAPITVDIGPMVRQTRMEEISQGHPIAGRFYASVKRYLGRGNEEIEVSDGTQPITKPAKELLQATWSALLNKFNIYRDTNPTRHSKGMIKHAIATYPTVAPPHVRKEIVEQLHSLGVEHVTIKYDEAVASAIFHFMCATAGGNTIGMEAFLSRCRTVNETQRRQNVLVFDIGGGTTDVALIQLNVHERSPQWEPNENRGAGGRYYEVVPRLLGSSGHTQLGGDVLSLRTFYLLKAIMADEILGSTLREANPTVLQRSRRLHGEPFFLSGAYQRRSLIEHTLSRQSAHHSDALELIETLLPTRWKDEPSRAQAFYSLWQHAEDAKIHLGKKHQAGDLEEPFELSTSALQKLLMQFEIETTEIPFTLRLERGLFDKSILPDLEEAAQLAKGLLSRLPTAPAQGSASPVQEPLDWLILSGKTCQLAQTETAMRKQFAGLPQFSWNPERVTRDPNFAKLATSAGACYAEKLWQFAVTPDGAKDLLRKGIHQFYFNVKNLYYFLPCAFLRIVGATSQSIFDAGTELKQLHAEKAFGAARSAWLPSTMAVSIQRRDHDNGVQKNWGYFFAGTLSQKLQIPESDWLEHIQLQFEVNHQLQFQLSLCRGKAHYLVEDSTICLRDVFESLKKPSTPPDPKKPITPTKTNTTQTSVVDASFQSPPPPRLAWDIAVGVNASGFHADGNETRLFSAETPFVETFHCPQTKRKTRGLISAALPDFSQHTHQHFLYARKENGNWSLLGVLQKPKVRAEYPLDYRLTIDEDGRIGLFAGEVPYLTSKEPRCLIEQPGCVYSEEITSDSNDHDEKRDPFNGTH